MFVLEESSVSRRVLDGLVGFLAQRPSSRLLFAPATANAVGLRRLGFSEQLRTDAKAWLAVGSDPLAMVGGRQHVLTVETLVVVSPVRTATTERAHVVFPMRLPYEARGHVFTGRGRASLSIAAGGPLALESWEVLLRLADALDCGPSSRTYEAIVEAASCAGEQRAAAATAAEATPAGIASVIDRRLDALGV